MTIYIFRNPWETEEQAPYTVRAPLAEAIPTKIPAKNSVENPPGQSPQIGGYVVSEAGLNHTQQCQRCSLQAGEDQIDYIVVAARESS